MISTIADIVIDGLKGDYEGLKPAEIKKINPSWKIWNDGYVYFIDMEINSC